MGRKKWSEEIKAQAMADLASGMKVADVAAKYGMPRSTAGALAPSSKAGALQIQHIQDLNDLEAAFRRQLALNFAAQEAIMQQVANAEWLAKQDGPGVVALHNALFRTGGKLLGALYGPAASASMDDTADPQDAT